MRFVLVLALMGAGWSIYRRLPGDDGAGALLGESQQTDATLLRVVLRRESNARDAATGEVRAANADAPGRKVPIQLYSVDVAAAQREFLSERRAGVRFEDFLSQRMRGQQPIAAELDERGETTVAVPPGRWWIHATLESAQELTWRLPVNVSGREKTVELTPDNAYTRAKKF